ncbi:MgtC/SapB family protein [Shimia biformata]|uniref:MgtC/SapB family protein n=1 Tax=Shimia biformata TaxID=1294299 RepID=UPI00194EECF2|nr:MgtC/SapB family protein [Shimia biformata]
MSELPVLGLDQAAINLTVALFCGALIGSERQVRQRMAGLRTNALVALGAATFVVFSSLYPTELSPTRVGAQVVSGIGFLGAGIIFRHGFNVHGLNTAATLWCSAAVGLIAGAGAILFAALATGAVIFVNLGLRPLVKWLKKTTRAGVPLTQEFRVVLRCAAGDTSKVRKLALQTIAQAGVRVLGFDLTRDEEEAELEIILSVNDLASADIDKVLSPLMIDPRVDTVNWDPVTES